MRYSILIFLVLLSQLALANPTVVIIDSGVVGFDTVETVDFTGEGGEDTNGHGTLMAAIILDQCPDAKLISLKILGKNGGSFENLRKALQWCKDNSNRITVINYSGGDGGNYTFIGDDAVLRLIRDLYSLGVPVVAAAGNRPGAVGMQWPAIDSSTISVGAAGLQYLDGETDAIAPGLQASQATAYVSGTIASAEELRGESVADIEEWVRAYPFETGSDVPESVPEITWKRRGKYLFGTITPPLDINAIFVNNISAQYKIRSRKRGIVCRVTIPKSIPKEDRKSLKIVVTK